MSWSVEGIKGALAAGDAATLPHRVALGELLMEAEEQVPLNRWGRWLERHFGLSERDAREYMILARKTARGPAA